MNNSPISEAGRAARRETWAACRQAIFVAFLIGAAFCGGVFLQRRTCTCAEAPAAPTSVPTVDLGPVEAFTEAIEKADAKCGPAPLDVTVRHLGPGQMEFGYHCNRPPPIGKAKLPPGGPTALVRGEQP